MSNEIDNIIIQYDNAIEAINVEYVNEIDNIILTLGADTQSVFSVNNLTGNVILTASVTLSLISPVSGIYSYTFNHNLGTSIPNVSIYNLENKLVIADIEVIDSNSVTINSVIDLEGYKVVVQK